jgi:hypothetical protein
LSGVTKLTVGLRPGAGKRAAHREPPRFASDAPHPLDGMNVRHLRIAINAATR